MAASRNTNTDAFFNLVRAGLWEQDVQLASYGKIDFNEVYRLAEEQSVVGLVSAGIEHIVDVKVPQEVALTFIGSALQLEQRNKAMNQFIGVLIEKLRAADIYTLLVKGQGVAQCYERPLWRSSGDVDLLLKEDNYKKAQLLFDRLADSYNVGTLKEQNNLHREYHIKDWVVELHGTMNSNLSKRIDRLVSSIMNQVFYCGDIRVWDNGGTAVFLPSSNADIIIVFVHILQHLFNGGIGLRQICDWCRLIRCYQDQINDTILEKRLKNMGLMSEWKAFASLAVYYLGMPPKSIPLYDSSKSWVIKARRIISYILYTGNFGHHKNLNYTTEHSAFVRKCISVYIQTKESFVLSLIFPLDTPKFYFRFIKDGLKAVVMNVRK